MNQLTLTIAIFMLRVVIGLRLVFPGWMMIQMGPYSSKGYLENVQGPFAGFFHTLAQSKTIDYLNKWALFLSGLALVFGVFARPASLIGIFLMIFYWLSKLPHKEGVIDERIISIAAFFLLIVLNAGIWWGFDYLLLRIPAILTYYQAHRWMQWVL